MRGELSVSIRSSVCFLLLCVVAQGVAYGATASFTLTDVLAYPFVSQLVVADTQDRIAWVQSSRGIRNVWVAEAPAYVPRQITQNSQDDGLELTQLMFSPDGSHVIYVRGGDHEQNTPPPGNPAPNPTLSPQQQFVSIWSACVCGSDAVKLVTGDSPAISTRGVLAFVKEGQVWTMPLEEGGEAAKLFSDRGHDGSLQWSPDGSRLAFVSDRTDHTFIGVFTSKDRPLTFLAPSTSIDDSPRWSADGSRIAFVRSPGDGGEPQLWLSTKPQPWSIWVADASTGEGRSVWQSPHTPEGSLPDLPGIMANVLRWAGGDRLVFIAELDNWPHLYSLSLLGGEPLLLTPGNFMVEDVAESRDQRYLIYAANTGTNAGDDDRRHVFYVPVERADPRPVTTGQSIETSPVFVGGDRVAFISADALHPTSLETINLKGDARKPLYPSALPASFPADRLVIPRQVRFKAADGVELHGQLFVRSDGPSPKPGIIFVHGGPLRQMYLGWHNMEVYSDHYAVNQYLASRGFAVLSVNYRLGIGYGRRFQHPEYAGPNGASEYQDVLAAVKALQAETRIDPNRIGIWGSSYGGYLTSLALARNSDVFKTGVDIYGDTDLSAFIAPNLPPSGMRFEQFDRERVLKDAWLSSPLADVARWQSPVLIIHGDDDRNVPFQQSIDLTVHLQMHHVPYEELVIPNETHSFKLYSSRQMVDERLSRWFEQRLGPSAKDTHAPPHAVDSL
jgi:dipeptidyl aminopeptidase/acylaminoacyl peptidase